MTCVLRPIAGREAVRQLIAVAAAEDDDVDLGAADLRGLDLRDLDLEDASFADADLRGADLRGAILRFAEFARADLRGALLRGADLRGAYLDEVDLTGVDLAGALVGDPDPPSFAALWGRPVPGALREEWPAWWRALAWAALLPPLLAALALAVAHTAVATRVGGWPGRAPQPLATVLLFGSFVAVVAGKLGGQLRALARDPRVTVALVADPRSPESPVAVVALAPRAPLDAVRVRVVCRQLIGRGEDRERRDVAGPDLFAGDRLGLVPGMVWRRSLPLAFPVGLARAGTGPADAIEDHWRIVVTAEGQGVWSERHFPFALERA